ncbi:MAG TPA: hypothetical protein IAC60_01555 [Candidatus Enterosoma merdigallinarum]|nr:hypothetical protein [Candidatus Enterosoma merdigallinarum]
MARVAYEITSKPVETTANKFEIMRKFQLILKNEIKNGNSSAVSQLFKDELSPEKISAIKFIDMLDSKDIDISQDQYRTLRDYISDGKSYPVTHFSHKEMVDFLKTLIHMLA